MNPLARLVISLFTGAVLALGICGMSIAGEDGPRLGFPGKGSYEDYKRAWRFLEEARTFSFNDPRRVKLISRAIQIYPYDAGSYYDLGNSLDELGQLKEAEQAYRQAIKMAPNVYEFWSNLGICLKKQKQFDEALASYAKAIEIDPRKTIAPFNAGNLLLDLKRPSDAIFMYEKTVHADPKYRPAWTMIGCAYEDLGKLSEAENAYKKAISLEPKVFNNWYFLAKILKKQQRWNEAQKALESAQMAAVNDAEKQETAKLISEINTLLPVSHPNESSTAPRR